MFYFSDNSLVCMLFFMFLYCYPIMVKEGGPGQVWGKIFRSSGQIPLFSVF